MTTTLKQIQEEVKVWEKKNFGDRPGWQPLLGLQEEVGELAHHYLKRAQGIRISEDHNAGIADAVADIVIYLLDFCNTEGIDLEATLKATWQEVSKRDWTKNRLNGQVEDKQP
jgi:NTP pyrophosphatase (non-canonical NTP hydrolase)